VISTGFRADQVRRTLGDEYRGLQLVYSEEPSPLGTAGALRHALGVLPDGLVFVMNGDSFVNADLGAYLRMALQAGGAGVLASGASKRTPLAMGRLRPMKRDHVGFRLREKEGIRKSGWINAGVYLFPCTWIAELTASRAALARTGGASRVGAEGAVGISLRARRSSTLVRRGPWPARAVSSRD